jgi:hypothetical protein
MNALYWPGMSAQYEGATDTMMSASSNSFMMSLMTCASGITQEAVLWQALQPLQKAKV